MAAPSDAHVDDHHDDERYVEGDERGEDQVVDVVGKGARVGGQVGLARPGERAPVGDGRERDAGRAEPDESDEDEPVAREPARVVVDRVRDGRVAVESDDEQRVDRGGRGEHVDRVPDVAPWSPGAIFSARLALCFRIRSLIHQLNTIQST